MNNATSQLFGVQSIPLKYKRIFGEELDIYDVIELAKDPLRDMGSFGTKKYLYKSKSVNGIVPLPKSVYAINSVTTSQPLSIYEHFFVVKSETKPLINYRVNPYSSTGMDETLADVSNQVVSEELVDVFEIVQRNNPTKRPQGNYVDFNHEDGVLKGVPEGLLVDVIFTEVEKDEEGFVMFNEKAQIALVYYFHYIKVQRNYYKGLTDGNMLAKAEQTKDTLIAAARSPIKLTDNQMDQLLNVFTSHNKKQHNIPFKS